MSISITKKTSTHNTTASAGRSTEYIGIHYTAGVKSTSGSAANVANYFAATDVQASADFIVDDATIVQYNPDPANRYCWAVGGSKQNSKGGSLYGKAKNANTISIEICSTNSTGTVKDANDSTWSLSDAAVAKAVELTKYLMDLYGIDADHVIRHYDVNGKLCPGVVGWNADSGSEAKWNAFKAQLASSDASTSTGSTSTSTGSTSTSTGSTSTSTGGTSSASTSKTATDAAQSKDSSLAGTYKVTASTGLNIRNGAGTGKSVLVAIPKDTTVRCYGYYSTASKGTKWLYVTFTYNGVTYTGFGSSTYLEKQ